MICIAGKNRIAVDVAQYVLERIGKESIIILPNSSDCGLDTWQPSLKKWAIDKKVPIVSLEDLYTIKDLVFFSLEFDKLIIPSRFQTKKLFNIHFSSLPEYRGAHTSIWPILDGKDSSGVTLHKIDRGIDTGDIIDQEEFILEQEDNSFDLYMNYQKHAFSLFKKNFNNIIEDKFQSFPQAIEKASFKSRKDLDFVKLTIDLNRTAYQVKNQIRAYTFRPYQMPSLNGSVVSNAYILNSRSTEKPGTLLQENEETLCFSTVDYDILIEKDVFEKALKCCYVNSPKNEMEKIFSQLSDYEIRNAKGWTLFIVAAYNYYIDGVEWLIERGVSPNQTNYKGTSILMYLKSAPNRNGRLDLIKKVIAAGGDISLQDYKGMSLADYAKLDNDTALINFINKLT